MIPQLALVAAAYVLGATPTSHWVATWFYGRDLRREGSGNLGATNTYRVLGLRAALPVFLADVFKGWAPAALFPTLVPGDPGWAAAFGGAAVLGHVFSFWVGFRGGKGVATASGVFLALAPWATLVAFALWIGAVFSTRYVSLGSILAAIAIPAGVMLLPHRGGSAVVVLSFALSGFVIWAHRANIRRLLRGEENRFGGGGRRTEAARDGSDSAPRAPAGRGPEGEM